MARRRKTPKIPDEEPSTPQTNRQENNQTRYQIQRVEPQMRPRPQMGVKRLPGYDYNILDVSDPSRNFWPRPEYCQVANFHNRAETVRVEYVSYGRMDINMENNLRFNPDGPKATGFRRENWQRRQTIVYYHDKQRAVEEEIHVPIDHNLAFQSEYPRFNRPFAGQFHPNVGMTFRQYRLWCVERFRPRYVKGAEDLPSSDAHPSLCPRLSDITDPLDKKAFLWSMKIHQLPRFKLAPTIRSDVEAERPFDEQKNNPFMKGFGNELVRDLILSFIPMHRDRTNLAATCQKLDEMINYDQSLTAWDLRTQDFGHCEKEAKDCDELEKKDKEATSMRRVRPILVVQSSHDNVVRSLPTTDNDIEGTTHDAFGKMMTGLHFFRNQVRILHLHKVPLLNAASVGIMVRSLPHLSFLGIYDCELIDIGRVPFVLDIISKAKRSDTVPVVQQVVSTSEPIEPPSSNKTKSFKIGLDIFPAVWSAPDDVERVGSFGHVFIESSKNKMHKAQLLKGIMAVYLDIISTGFELGTDFTEKGCAMRNWIENLPLDHGMAMHIVDLGCRHMEILKSRMRGLTSDEQKDVLFRQENHIGYLTFDYFCNNLIFQPLSLYGSESRPRFRCSSCKRTNMAQYLMYFPQESDSLCSICHLRDIIDKDTKRHHILRHKRKVAVKVAKAIAWDEQKRMFKTTPSGVLGGWKRFEREATIIEDLATFAQAFKLNCIEAKEYNTYLERIKELESMETDGKTYIVLKSLERVKIPPSIWTNDDEEAATCILSRKEAPSFTNRHEQALERLRSIRPCLRSEIAEEARIDARYRRNFIMDQFRIQLQMFEETTRRAKTSRRNGGGAAARAERTRQMARRKLMAWIRDMRRGLYTNPAHELWQWDILREEVRPALTQSLEERVRREGCNWDALRAKAIMSAGQPTMHM